MLFIQLFLSIFFTPTAHDVKVSLCNITYDEVDKSVMVDFRLFTDDLQSAINKPLLTNPLDKQFDADIRNYIESNFKITINQQPIKWYFFSRKANEEVFEMVFIIPSIRALKEIEIHNSILVEVFEKQQNLIKLNAYEKQNNYILNRQEQVVQIRLE